MKKTFLFFAAMCVMLSAAVAQVSVWDGSHTTWTNGNGTETNPYLIENAQHLAYLAYYTNNGTGAVNHIVGSNTYWKLTTNIDLNNLPWTPAGYYNSDADNYLFGGHLNGNGYTIANLSVNAARAGLFGRIEGGSIKNLGITGNSSVTGSAHVGGLTGSATGTFTLENCYYTGAVSGTAYTPTGGLIGTISAGSVMISNCYNTGNVSSSYTGGIVGYITNNSSVTINNCYNTGNITGSNNAGGLIGYIYNNDNSVNLSNCYNTGNISSSTSESPCAGGLIGYIYNNSTVSIDNCNNTGRVSNTNGFAGGIIACIANNAHTVTLNNCHNTGAVSSVYAGGMIGYVYHSNSVIINNCYNKTSISYLFNSSPYASHIGGIIGYIDNGTGTINNCYNTGSITSITSAFYRTAGGIIGHRSSSNNYNVGNCYSTGNITSVYAGGIIGDGSFTFVTNCHYRSGSASSPGGGTSQTEAFMKTQEFVDLLNNGPAPNSAYKLDNLLINSGYPVLLWQGNNTTATLSNLTVSEGVLTPAFNSETYNYTVAVDYSVSSITITATATDPAATVTGAGVKTLTVGANTFTITVTAADGTTTQDYTVTVTRAVGIDENSAVAHFTLYPNPTTGELRISPAGGGRGWNNGQLTIENVEVFDIYGRNVSSHHLIISSSNQLINISHLSAGIYFVKIRTEAGEVVRKVVKE